METRTSRPTHQRRAKSLIAALTTVVVLAACGGRDGSAPTALPLVDETESTTTAVDDAAIVPSTTSTTVATTTTTTTTSTTTTEAPPPVPLEPTLIVECATSPRTVTVTFADEPGTPLDWEFAVNRHPGGTGLAPISDVLDSGSEAPVDPVSYEIAPNDLGFTIESSNPSGSAEATVSVQRYTGCPVAGSMESRTVDHIDCVSGAFQFIPGAGSGITVESVLVDRIGGADDTLPVNPNGVYWIGGWDGPEEVKAIVTFSDALGTYEEHINHWCFGGPFIGLGGDYKVCADEAVMIAYPADWVSTIDLDGPEGNSCAFFRYGPVDGHVDHNVTLESLGAVTMAQATANLLPPGPWIIANQESVNPSAFSDRVGTTAGGERIRFELAWDSAPTLSRRVVWLIEAGGQIWRLETNIQGLNEIDGMSHSLQFIVQ